MYCASCGCENADGACFCAACGCAINDDVRQKTLHVSASPQRVMSNERVIAILLCVFLGWLGIHRFYTKNMGIAVAQLVLGGVSCFSISLIWSVIDLLLLLTGVYKTGDGRFLI